MRGRGVSKSFTKIFLKTSPIFAQKNKPICGRFIFSSTFAGISFPCVDYLFDYLLITELPKRPIYRHFQEQITGIEPAFPAWEASVLPMNHICKRNIKYYTPCSFILPVLIFTIFIILLIQHSQPLQSVPDAVFIHVRGDIICRFQHLFTGITHGNADMGIL